MATMWWHSKGSTTSTSAPAYFLRTHSLHQRFNCYLPQHNFVRGIDNGIFDLPSRSVHITDAKLLHQYNTQLPQPLLWRMCNPSSKSVYCVVSALRRRPPSRAFLLQDLPLPIPTGQYGPPSAPTWPSPPYSCRTGTIYRSSPPSPLSSAMVTSAPAVIMFDPE